MEPFCTGENVGAVLWTNGPTECSSYVVLPSIITVAALSVLCFSHKKGSRSTNLMFKLFLPIFALCPIINAIIEGAEEQDISKYIVDAVIVAIFSGILFLATTNTGFYRWHTLFFFFAINRINIIWNDFTLKSAGSPNPVAEGFHWTELFVGLLLTIVFPGSRRARDEVRESQELSTELLNRGSEEVNEEGERRGLNPEENASLLQLLVFGWLTPIIHQAFKKGEEGESLLRSDLPPLNKRDLALESYKKLEAKWEYEVTSGRRSLTRALGKAFWKEVFHAGLIKIINDLLHFANPMLLSMLMTFLNPTSGEYMGNWHGWIIAVGMCGTSLLQSLLLAHYFQIGFRSGMHVRSATIMLISKKALRISPDSFAPPTDGVEPPRRRWCRGACFCCNRQTPSQLYSGGTGEVVNLITADTDRFGFLCPYIHLIWSAPLQLVLCLGFLFYFVGWSFFGSVVVMLLSTGSSAFIQTKSVSLQKKVMAIKDERLKVQNELVNAIKMVKIYGWEDTMQSRVSEIRERELKLQMKFKILGGIQMLQFSVAPIFVSAACFFTYAIIMGENISAEVIYPAMTLFGILSFPLASLPMMLNFLAQAQVSIRRIENFMAKTEVRGLPPITNDGSSAVMELQFDKLTWANDTVLLHGPAHIKILRGEFVAVTGATGSGKTGLLDALTGEISCDVQLKVRAKIRLVTQSPWIRSASVKQNIVGDEPFILGEYQKTLACCGLLQDLDSLADRDETIVGNRGVMLSGGQRVRVALARAVYSLEADIFIFDDILSAVDAHVAKHILAECILGRLAGKTVVLATHSKAALHASHRIIHLSDKRVSYDGATAQWVKRESDAVATVGLLESSESEEEKEVVSTEKTKLASAIEEDVSRGAIPWSIYRNLFSSMGGLPWMLFFAVSLLTSEVGRTSSDLWLQHWVAHTDTISAMTGISAYVAFAVLVGVLTFSFIFIRIALGQKASRKLHLDCQYTILRATMAFIDLTPSGRIVNRLSEDTVILDSNLPTTLSLNCQWFLRMIIIFLMCAMASPWIIVAFFPIYYLFMQTQRYYVPSARDLRRLDSTAKGPIFSHMGEVLHGLSTIRVHGMQNPMHATSLLNLDTQNQAYFLNNTSNRWLSVRMQLAGAVLVSVTVITIVALRDKISSATAGLVISYAMRLTDTLSALNRESADRETQMICAERLIEYSKAGKVPIEAPLRIASTRPADTWPQGDFVWNDVAVRYRPDLPLVLRNISFTVKQGSSLGVCGRTGAGKSSVIMAMMRIVEVDAGVQLLDGVDTKTIGLHDLRSRMLVIPQDPVIFSGTVRFNLDPFNEHADEKLWEAIERSNLYDKIESLGGLQALVGEAGKGFSHGERQLLALCRALVRKTTFGLLLLDEATSSVDDNLDVHIQNVVREDFSNQGITVISIAHRLKTIVEYDNIAVFDAGELRELGPARALYAKNGLFRALADESGLGYLK